MKRLLYCTFFICQFSYAQDSAKINKLIKQGLELERKGDIDNAIKTHKKVLDINPASYQSANTIAGLYGLKQDFTSEIVWAEKALKLKPDYSMGYVNLGNGYAGQNNLKRAEECFLQAEQYDSTSAYPPYSLGVLEEMKGHFKAAIVYYERSVARDSTFENGYYNLAAAYANIKDFKKANTNIVKVLQLNPDAKDARELYAHIIEELLKQ